MPRPCPDAATLRPMLATSADARLDDPELVYEPKYDGIRVLAEIAPSARGARLFSRLGNDKAAQFPELAQKLAGLGRRRSTPTILDGEIVALDGEGRPTSFVALQTRLHRARVGEREIARHPVRFIAFDLVCHGGHDLCEQPLIDRRRALERFLGRRQSPWLALSTQVAGDGHPLMAQAHAEGWEGLIAKRATSRYWPGKRTSDWRKVKLVRQQELIVGGWTEPRASRARFGALLLGYSKGRQLVYAGRVGSGFDERELDRLWHLLEPLERKRCPFAVAPQPDEKPHWVKPTLVAEVKFTEWTPDGMLRHPVYLGLRDDVAPATVRREPDGRPRVRATAARAKAPRPAAPPPTRRRAPPAARRRLPATLRRLRDELAAIEQDRGDGVVTLPDGVRLSVTNLGKVFWPDSGLTKGTLLRHYITVAPYILPVVANRPLVMQRFPNGVTGKAFYQQRAPETVPEGVRVEAIPGDSEVPARLVGGDLATLLHMAQLAVISQDPWFSRVDALDTPDQVAIDLDPGDGVPFSRIRDVARWVRDELDTLRVMSFPKTSGADGLHIYVPMRPGVPYEAGMIFCQIVATLVAEKHPAAATVERRVRSRRSGTVYLDCLQNIEGKTLACAYSARASEYGGVSTPVTWDEIDDGVDRKDFTLETIEARLDQVGDLWAALRKSAGADLRAVERYLTPDT